MAIATTSARIVTVAATKGGAGKTTTAVALTCRLNSLEPGTVQLLDLDRQRTASKWIPTFSTAPAAPVRHAEDVRRLAIAKVTVVDVPPGAPEAAAAAIEAADIVVAVTGLGQGDLDGMADLARMVEPDLVIPTQYDRRYALHGVSLEHLSRRFGGRLTMPVPAAAAVQRAQAAQQPIGETTPPGIAYAEATGRLLTLLDNLVAQEARR